MDYTVTKNEESLEALWARTKRMHEEIEERIDCLEMSQLDDVLEERKLLEEKKSAEFGKLPTSVQSTILQKDKMLKKTKKSTGKSILLALAMIAVLFVVKFFVFDFTIISKEATYISCISGSLILSALIFTVRNAALEKKINGIQKIPQVAAYMELVGQFEKETAERIAFINSENGKYAEDWSSIRDAERECAYENVRDMVLSARYANTVFLYCKKFSMSTYCVIELDGVEVLNTRQKGTHSFRINDGYHTVKINYIFHQNIGGSIDHKEYYFTNQLNGSECPLFIALEYVDASRLGSCETVTYDRFVELCGKELV